MDHADSDDVVEISPDGRYIRYNEILGRGAFKTVYKAFDEIDGIEVAWNQVSIEDALQSPEHLERLYSEVHLLRTVKHENVIRSYASWVDEKNKTINMITELFTSGSLRQYRKKHKSVDMKAIKNWARQILRGLEYLHTHQPPIIHRDLKCDNIFVNGNHGEVKIGDLGLATIMRQATARSVIGTPEFMAPELYDEEYNELIDIYSFGMCMLELITCEYPYSECKNQAQIYKKVTSGKKPASLEKVENSELKQLIEICLVPASQRPSATSLLKVPFLSTNNSQNCNFAAMQLPSSTNKSMNSFESDSSANDLAITSTKMASSSTTMSESMTENTTSIVEVHRFNERFKFFLKLEKPEHRKDDSLYLCLLIEDYNGWRRQVHFFYYFDADTSISIATEMVEQLELMEDDVTLMAGLIDDLISKVAPWQRQTQSGNFTDAYSSLEGNTSGTQDEESQASGNLQNEVRTIDLLISDNRYFEVTDNHIEKDNNDKGDLLMTGSMINSKTSSYAGSWITASNGMSWSMSSLSLTDKDDDLCNDLMAIEMDYQRCCEQLLKQKEEAIEIAKKKWFMKKISVS